MTDKILPAQISRRSLLRGLGAGVVKLPGISVIRASDGDLDISDDMLGAFCDDPRFKKLFALLEYLYEEENTIRDYMSIMHKPELDRFDIESAADAIFIGKDLSPQELTDSYNDQIMDAFHSLRQSPPRLQDAYDMVNHFVFKNLHTYSHNLLGLSPDKAVLRYMEISRMSDAQFDALLAPMNATRQSVFEGLARRAAADPRITKKAEEYERKYRSQTNSNEQILEAGFPDMAAARKAAMYPIPDSVSDEQQEHLGIGLHAQPYASGCEHRGTIGSRDVQLRAHYESKPAR